MQGKHNGKTRARIDVFRYACHVQTLFSDEHTERETRFVMHGDVAIVTIRSHFYCFYLRVLRDVQIHSGFSRNLAKKCERHATRLERKPSKIRDEPVTRDLSPERKKIRGRISRAISEKCLSCSPGKDREGEGGSQGRFASLSRRDIRPATGNRGVQAGGEAPQTGHTAGGYRHRTPEEGHR